MLTRFAAALLALSLWSSAALAMRGGVVFAMAGAGGGGGGAFSAGVPNPYKYYPVCTRGRAGAECQCRIAGQSEANVLCRVGEYCDTRNGTCGPSAPSRK